MCFCSIVCRIPPIWTQHLPTRWPPGPALAESPPPCRSRPGASQRTLKQPCGLDSQKYGILGWIYWCIHNVHWDILGQVCWDSKSPAFLQIVPGLSATAVPTWENPYMDNLQTRKPIPSLPADFSTRGMASANSCCSCFMIILWFTMVALVGTSWLAICGGLWRVGQARQH